ncbi:hypothetical protein Fot_42265 [Forsythia ovata]|uniref:Uncharacterized protein n=1 Tax=Forsythia ovata TaxID=205694 RepID=A0ABD1RKP2_9LAMI
MIGEGACAIKVVGAWWTIGCARRACFHFIKCLGFCFPPFAIPCPFSFILFLMLRVSRTLLSIPMITKKVQRASGGCRESNCSSKVAFAGCAGLADWYTITTCAKLCYQGVRIRTVSKTSIEALESI